LGRKKDYKSEEKRRGKEMIREDKKRRFMQVALKGEGERRYEK
jgi:hypothetical protein